MLDATDLYRRLRFDLFMDSGISLEEAAPIAYEAVQSVLAGNGLGDWLRISQGLAA